MDSRNGKTGLTLPLFPGIKNICDIRNQYKPDINL